MVHTIKLSKQKETFGQIKVIDKMEILYSHLMFETGDIFFRMCQTKDVQFKTGLN